jgi:DNA polymerase III delta prime subunit
MINCWTEKYRPHTFLSLKGQPEINAVFGNNNLVEQNQTHFLFYGSPGTGKTSTALIYCQDLYGQQAFQDYVLEINASYESDLAMVQTKIKQFCQKSIMPFTKNGHSIRHKVIILDEADTLSHEAQHSLRRYIEVYSFNTRFIFLCNYITKIIYPIVSRCTTFHFSPIPLSDCIQYLQLIVKQENIICQGDDEHTNVLLSALCQHCNGDLRTCTASLQAITLMHHSTLSHSHIDQYFLQFPRNFFKDINVSKLTNYIYLYKYVQSKATFIVEHAYSVKMFLLFCIEIVSQCPQTPTIHAFIQKVALCEKYSLYEKDSFPILFWILTEFVTLVKEVGLSL